MILEEEAGDVVTEASVWSVVRKVLLARKASSLQSVRKAPQNLQETLTLPTP